MSRLLPLSYDLATRVTLPVGTREKRNFAISGGSVRLLLTLGARSRR